MRKGEGEKEIKNNNSRGRREKKTPGRTEKKREIK